MLARHRIKIKYSLITLALLAFLLIFDQTVAATIAGHFFTRMAALGFIGFFLIALIANSAMLIHIPYTLPLLSLALGGASLDRMLMMGTASGLGAGLGEIINYGMMLKVLGKIPAPADHRWIKHLGAAHPHLAPGLLFMWIVSPLPSDMIIIPLAMVHYKLKQVSLPLFAGKLVNNVGIAAIFYYFTGWSAAHISGDVQGNIALGGMILFIMVILYQVEQHRWGLAPHPN